MPKNKTVTKYIVMQNRGSKSVRLFQADSLEVLNKKMKMYTSRMRNETRNPKWTPSNITLLKKIVDIRWTKITEVIRN